MFSERSMVYWLGVWVVAFDFDFANFLHGLYVIWGCCTSWRWLNLLQPGASKSLKLGGSSFVLNWAVLRGVTKGWCDLEKKFPSRFWVLWVLRNYFFSCYSAQVASRVWNWVDPALSVDLPFVWSWRILRWVTKVWWDLLKISLWIWVLWALRNYFSLVTPLRSHQVSEAWLPMMRWSIWPEGLDLTQVAPRIWSWVGPALSWSWRSS